MLALGQAHSATRPDCIGDEGGATAMSGQVIQDAVDAANGTPVVLCQSARFEVVDPIMLKTGTVIYTRALPTNNVLKAVLYYKVGGNIHGGHGILTGGANSNIEIRNLIVDGSRTSVEIEEQSSEDRRNRALIIIGGQNSIIDNVRAVNGFGLAVISAADDWACDGIRITNNFVGFSGFYTTVNGVGQWSDGIGLYCSNAYVANNEIRDITDGGITFYGGTNTIIEYNWIANSGRSAVSGLIAAAAQKRQYGTLFKDFYGSQIRNNTIETAPNIHIQIALSAGSRMWCNAALNNKDCDYINGISIINNTGTGNFGYGIVVSGANSVNVTGDNLIMTPWINPKWNNPSLQKCKGTNWYIVETGSGSGTLQSGYLTRNDTGGCAWY